MEARACAPPARLTGTHSPSAVQRPDPQEYSQAAILGEMTVRACVRVRGEGEGHEKCVGGG